MEKKNKNYSILLDYVKLVNDKKTDELIKNNFQNQIRQVLEPKLRKSIVQYIKKKFNTKDQRLKAINRKKEFTWI